MEHTKDSFSGMCLSEQITCFNQQFAEFEKTDENSFYYSTIMNSLLLRLYNLIISCRLADKEGASELLLSMTEIIPHIVHSCKAKTDDELDSFLIATASHRKHNIQKKADNARRREQLIISRHLVYEYMLDNQERSEESFKSVMEQDIDDTQDRISRRKLLYIFSISRKIRIRFYVYLLSQGRALSYTVLDTICKQFRFDIPETKSLIQKLRDMEGNGKEQKYQNKEGLRNSRWEKLLAAENSESMYSYLCDDQKSADFAEIAEKRRKSHNSTFLRYPCSIPPALIASILGISRSSTYLYIAYSRTLIQWCYDPDSVSKDDVKALNLPGDVIQAIKTGRYDDELKNMRPLHRIKPSEIFGINFQ